MTDQTPALQRPATRAARLSAIEQALLTCIVTSQSQLSQILADQGIEVTQATLSRDLDEIHATKTRLADGTVAYALGKQPEEAALANPDAKTEQQMNRVLSGLVTSVAAARESGGGPYAVWRGPVCGKCDRQAAHRRCARHHCRRRYRHGDLRR